MDSKRARDTINLSLYSSIFISVLELYNKLLKNAFTELSDMLL